MVGCKAFFGSCWASCLQLKATMAAVVVFSMAPEALPDEMVEVRRVGILKMTESFEGEGSFKNRMIF